MFRERKIFTPKFELMCHAQVRKQLLLLKRMEVKYGKCIDVYVDCLFPFQPFGSSIVVETRKV